MATISERNEETFTPTAWSGRCGFETITSARTKASAVLISVLWMSLSLAMTHAEIIVETQKLFFGPNEEVGMPVSYSGAAINYRVRNYSGEVVLQGQQADTELELGLFSPGYYTLELSSGSDALTTNFAVMTPITADTAWPFGVQTHFAQFHDPELLRALKAAGIAHIRDEQYWSSLEEPRGVFTYPEKYVDYMGAAQANSIQPFICLTWSNPFYDYEAGEFTFPHSDSGRAGFVRYARELLNRWGNQIKEVELWNEPGANFFRGPATADRAGHYTQLLKELYPAVKQLRSDVKVVAGATFPLQHGFFRSMFEDGALSYMDAASIHPYGVIETLPLEVGELRGLMGSQVKPVWITEFSYGPSDEEGRRRGATELAQQVAIMLSIGIQRMYYYLAQDDSIFPVRGLIGEDDTGNWRPHPAYAAYATIIRQLGGAGFVDRLPTSLSVYALRFRKGTQQTIALWSQFPATVQLTGSVSSAVNIVGLPLTVNPAAVEIGPDPIYVTGAVGAVSELVNPVVADSRSGYSKTVGENGWSYGWSDRGSSDPYSPADFRPMEWRIWRSDNYRWVVPGRDSPFAGHDGMHPQSGTWAIRRWTSNLSGRVTLRGYLERGSGGDGNGIRIFVDATEVHSEHLAPNQSREYVVPDVQVNVGSRIDFAVTAHGNSNGDAVVHTSTILRDSSSGVPTPPTNLHIEL